MAKTSGVSWTVLSVDNSGGTPQDIRNDLNSFQVSTPRAVQEITGIDKAAVERQLLLADASLTLNAIANFGAGATVHAVFSDVTSTSVKRTVTNTIGGKTLAMEILFTDYPMNRANDGALTMAIPGVLGDGTVPTWA